MTTSFITVNTNQSPWCNATSGGDSLNFYRADTGCWNLGEIPGVAIHEWGHSFDSFDGSGAQSRPVETYADWMAALHLHDSCVGRGFFLSGNCGGYGDACTSCSGIRDMDYTQHQANTPWTAANYGTVWRNCSSGSYFGPCNLEDHCEAGISEQALWDLVHSMLTAPPYSMDLRTAWLLADRLWYHGVSTLAVNMYNCSRPSSDGCNNGSLYNVMMAIDDDGDGTANGTPHAAAIFAALDDHNIACGLATDPENQDQSSCPGVGSTTISGEGLNNSAEITWTAVPNATRYLVFRNDIGCDAGMTRIAEVTAPTTSYLDTSASGDVTYSYVVTAKDVTGGCESARSDCAETQTTGDCTEAPGFAGLQSVTNAGVSTCTLDLDWDAATEHCGGPVSYNVYRSTTPGFVPAGANRIASGVIGTQLSDATGIDFETDYYYVVRAVDDSNSAEDDNLVELSGRPTGPFSIRFEDDFEGGNLGWTFTDGSPAATTGDFLIGDPVGTVGNYGDDSQPGDDHTPDGVNCLYSDENPNGEVGVDDIDNGEVIATSPTFDGSGLGGLALDMWRWFFNEDNDDSGDYYVLEVSNDNGSTWTQLESIPGTVTGTNSWINVSFDLAAHITLTSTMKLRVRAADGPANGDLVELAIDDIVIDYTESCTSTPIPLPGPFGKSSPADGATSQPTDLTLSWDASTDAATYEICYDTTDNDSCDGAWIDAGATTSATVNGLAGGTTYFWQVRGVNATGSTEADGGTWWQLSTEALLPGGFGKTAPADGATDQSTSPTLSWDASSDALAYEVCFDTTDDGACDGAWTDEGNTTSTTIGDLDGMTTYYWQVRATNPAGTTEADGGSWWQFTTAQILFEDGFESGDTSAWSRSNP